MARETDASKGENRHLRHRDDLPPEIMEIIWPAIQVGSLSGMAGLAVGGFAGIARSSPPVLFALASGIQWLTLGATFTASRGVVFHAWNKDKITSKDKVSASAIAGAVSGAVGGLLRSRRNVIPGALMFAVFGGAGQALYNKNETRSLEAPEANQKDNSWLNSKWSPMKVLSDSEYESMLRERLLKVDAEIAIIDENIEALRAQERQISPEESLREARDK